MVCRGSNPLKRAIRHKQQTSLIEIVGSNPIERTVAFLAEWFTQTTDNRYLIVSSFVRVAEWFKALA